MNLRSEIVTSFYGVKVNGRFDKHRNEALSVRKGKGMILFPQLPRIRKEILYGASVAAILDRVFAENVVIDPAHPVIICRLKLTIASTLP